MGWLGWTPDQALAVEVGLIEMALDSRRDLLAEIFGTGKKAEEDEGSIADRFKAYARKHNRRRIGHG